MNVTETLSVNGRQLSKRQMYLEALRFDRNNGHAYFYLGKTLSATDTVVLHDGRQLNRRDVYVEALRCDHKNSKSYTNLADALTATETVKLSDGRQLNRRQLRLEALRCEGNIAGSSRLVHSARVAGQLLLLYAIDSSYFGRAAFLSLIFAIVAGAIQYSSSRDSSS
jgi:hypothetical protein